jgi:hypothetical protein
LNPWQLTLLLRPPTQHPQRWDDKYIEGDESRSRVAWQRKHRFLYPAFEWDRRERGRFPRFDGDTPEVDSAIELALNNGFEKICGPHGSTACGEENVGGFEAALDDRNVGVDAVEDMRTCM